MSKKKFSTLFIISLLSTSIFSNQSIKAIKTLAGEKVYSYCKTISSPEFEGRLGGSPGFLKSANWVRTKFKEWGLKDINRNKYFQSHPSPYTELQKSSLILHLKKDKKHKKVELKLEQDYIPFLSSGNCSGKGKMVFAGWGIHAPELKYDDFYNLDIKGKYILCFRGTPNRKIKEYRKYSKTKEIVRIAKKRGALGIIYISKKLYGNVRTDAPDSIGVFHITRKTADIILEQKGLSSDKLYNDLKTYKRPLSFAIENEIEGTIISRHYKNAKGINIIGIVPGYDAKLKDEFIIIAAHLDHLGTHSDMVFNGAHDNASGSAVTLALAEAFSKIKSKRSLAFVLFDGEEKGLIGSSFFVKNIPNGIKKIKYMINFELCGDGNSIYCAVKSDYTILKNAFTKASGQVPVKCNFRERARGMSDYASFEKINVQTVCITCSGPHRYYHQTKDNIYRINPDILAAVTKFTFAGLYSLAMGN